MNFSIVTPSYNQLDWLRLCVASVRDQTGHESRDQSRASRTASPRPSILDPRPRPPLAVEHIIQDAGTPGIEDFAREIGADFYRDGHLVFGEGETSDEGRASRGEIRESSESSTSPATNTPRPSPPDPQATSTESSAAMSNEQSTISNYTCKVYCEHDSGMYDAINRGLRRASGEIRAYLNCDEQYLPGTLDFVANWFQRNPAKEVLFGDAIVVDDKGGYLCDRRVMPPTDWHTRVSGNLSFFTAATFFRTSVVTEKEILFNPEWKAVGDAVWALELVRQRVKMGTCSTALSTHTDTGENLILSPSSVEETRRFHDAAPRIARISKKLLLIGYRLRRLLAGAYRIQPHSYAIYTRSLPKIRTVFDVRHPTHQWKNR